MKEKLTYKDLEFPIYVNNSKAISLNAEVNGKTEIVELNIMDVVKAAVLSDVNMLFISDTGLGKSQLLTDIFETYFGGNVDDGGEGNWVDGRKDLDLQDDLFTKFENVIENGKPIIKKVIQQKKLEALVNITDELNRAPPPIQNEFLDLADGKRAIQGKKRALGREGYSLFLAAINLNKLNGDFLGTFQLDRALLNRAHLTINFDFYKPKKEDRIKIRCGGNPNVKSPEPKNLSKKILNVFKEITEKSKKFEPYLDAYLGFFDLGLEYCEKSPLKWKMDWPTDCNRECEHSNDKNQNKLCSLLKESTPRTTQAIKKLIYGLEYLIGLKKSKDLTLDPFELAFEVFKFTAYHGNLNQRVRDSAYKGDDHYMMESVVGKLREAIEKYKECINSSINMAINENRVCLEYIEYSLTDTETNETKARTVPYREDNIQELEKKKIQYRIINPFEQLQNEIGIGTDWFKEHLEFIIRNNQNTKIVYTLSEKKEEPEENSNENEQTQIAIK